MSTDSTLLSIREAARRLGVHDNTVRRYADRGLIRVVRLPSGVRRVQRADVEALSGPAADRSQPAGGRAGPTTGLATLAAEQRVAAVDSLDALVAPEIWPSDEEAAAFLTLTYAERDRDQ